MCSMPHTAKAFRFFFSCQEYPGAVLLYVCSCTPESQLAARRGMEKEKNSKYMNLPPRYMKLLFVICEAGGRGVI